MPKRRAEAELRRDDDERSDTEENFALDDGTQTNNRRYILNYWCGGCLAILE